MLVMRHDDPLPSKRHSSTMCVLVYENLKLPRLFGGSLLAAPGKFKVPFQEKNITGSKGNNLVIL